MTNIKKKKKQKRIRQKIPQCDAHRQGNFFSVILVNMYMY